MYVSFGFLDFVSFLVIVLCNLCLVRFVFWVCWVNLSVVLVWMGLLNLEVLSFRFGYVCFDMLRLICWVRHGRFPFQVGYDGLDVAVGYD